MDQAARMNRAFDHQVSFARLVDVQGGQFAIATHKQRGKAR